MQRNQPCVLLAEQSRGKNLVLYKPNIGRQTQPESLDNLLRKYHKVSHPSALGAALASPGCYIFGVMDPK